MLQHVTLEVRPEQVRDCVRFWELLGFTELEPPPTLKGRFFWVGRDDTQIHLQPVDEPVVPRSGHAAIVAPSRSAGGLILTRGSRAVGRT